jgi:hypothetical protein
MVAAVGLSFTLAGCGNGGALALARQACSHIDLSIQYYDRYLKATNPTLASLYLQRARNQLGLALPLAARATSADGSWNELMTDLQEGNRVGEGFLIPGLRASCANAVSGTPGLPAVPTNLPQEPTTQASTPPTASPSTSSTASGASG